MLLGMTNCPHRASVQTCFGFIVRREFASQRNARGWTNLGGEFGPPSVSLDPREYLAAFSHESHRPKPTAVESKTVSHSLAAIGHLKQRP